VLLVDPLDALAAYEVVEVISPGQVNREEAAEMMVTGEDDLPFVGAGVAFMLALVPDDKVIDVQLSGEAVQLLGAVVSAPDQLVDAAVGQQILPMKIPNPYLS